MTNDYHHIPQKQNITPKDKLKTTEDFELMDFPTFSQKLGQGVKGHWMRYKEYLLDKGALSPNLYSTVTGSNPHSRNTG